MSEPAAKRPLKDVSKAKHLIIEKYLIPWARILGTSHKRLAYFDCYAGAGTYYDRNDAPWAGSPVRALQAARAFSAAQPTHAMLLRFVEGDPRRANELRLALATEPNVPKTIDWDVHTGDADAFVRGLLSDRLELTGQPNFFFVDPFGLTFPVALQRQLLQVRHTELLVNLMVFSVPRLASHPTAARSLDRLFGHTLWRSQPFAVPGVPNRDRLFMQYFARQAGAVHSVPFSVRFDSTDRAQGGANRTKYYLLHLSNHSAAALTMKDVMLGVSDIEGALGFAGREAVQLNYLSAPDQVADEMVEEIGPRRLSFGQLRLDCLHLPFKTSCMRQAVKLLESAGRARVDRHDADKRRGGLDDRDEITFL